MVGVPIYRRCLSLTAEPVRSPAVVLNISQSMIDEGRLTLSLAIAKMLPRRLLWRAWHTRL